LIISCSGESRVGPKNQTGAALTSTKNQIDPFRISLPLRWEEILKHPLTAAEQRQQCCGRGDTGLM
jgi:hypothetical protein